MRIEREDWIRIVLAELRRQKHAADSMPLLWYSEKTETLSVEGEIDVGALVHAIRVAIEVTR